MRNGFNQFSVPYMNELTANALGAASVFGGNTPLGFINASLDKIGMYFQEGGGTIRSGREFDRIMREYEELLRRQGIPPGGTPPTFPKDQQGPIGPGSPGVPTLPPAGTPEGDRARESMGMGSGGGPQVNCSLFDLECWFSRLIGSETFKDAGKRVGLVILGGALLLVAIFSLR